MSLPGNSSGGTSGESWFQRGMAETACTPRQTFSTSSSSNSSGKGAFPSRACGGCFAYCVRSCMCAWPILSLRITNTIFCSPGNGVFLETDSRQVIELLRNTMQPMLSNKSRGRDKAAARRAETIYGRSLRRRNRGAVRPASDGKKTGGSETTRDGIARIQTRGQAIWTPQFHIARQTARRARPSSCFG